jgi:hypothetical protein
MTQRAVTTKDLSDGEKNKHNQPFAELQQQYTTYCRLRKKQFNKMKADETVGLIDTRSPKVYELMTTMKRTDFSPISAESWTEHLQSHFVQLQESAPDLLPGQFNLPARHQLLSGQLRSGKILPSDIAVPPGPGGRYRNMNTTFQRSNDRAPVYELPPIHTLATTIKNMHFKHEHAVQPRY